MIRLRRRTQQQVVGGLSFLLLLASGAWVWGEIARQQAHQAQTRQFQSTHLSLLEDDPMQSVVHGLAAMARLRGNLQQALPLAISLNRAVERNGLQRLWLSGQDEVWSLAETPSGRVISGGRDGSLRFWRADGQPEPGTLQTSHSAGVRGLVVISDQEWWTAGDDGLLQHWIGGLRQGPPIVTGHGSVQSLVRTPDGQLLSAGIDGFLRRWDLRTGQSLGRPLRSGHLEVWSLVVLPNGDWVSGGREGRLQWWREGRPRGMPIPSGQGAVSALVALPGNAILSGGDDGRLRYWDSVGHLLRSFNSGHNSIMSLLRLRQGSILSGGSERLTEAESSSIRSWLPPKTGLDNQILPGQIESLSLVELCNGDLISGASDGALYHWRDGHRLGQPIQTTHRRVDALTLLPSGDLVSGGDDGTLQVWRNGQVVARAPTDQGGVTSLATLVDGSLLSGGRDGSIRHLQLEDGALRRISSMHSHHGAVWAIAPLPDGDVLSGGDDGLIRRWRRGRQQGIALKTPHTTVVSLVVRSNGDWVSGGSGGDIQLWREGRRLGDFFHVDSGSVWSLVERRNRQIVSANGDGTIFT